MATRLQDIMGAFAQANDQSIPQPYKPPTGLAQAIDPNLQRQLAFGQVHASDPQLGADIFGTQQVLSKNYQKVLEALTPQQDFLKSAPMAEKSKDIGPAGTALTQQLQQAGVDRAHKVANDLARYGVTDISQLQVHTVNGKDVFYDAAQGKIIPQSIGSDGGHTFGLRNVNGTVGFDVKSSGGSFQQFLGAAALAFGGAAGLSALMGPAAAAGAAGAGAGGAGASAGLGTGLSSAGSSFGAGLGGVGTGFGAAGAVPMGGSALGSGLGMLGSGTSFLGTGAGLSSLGGAAGSAGLLSNLQSIYDIYSKGSSAYNAITGQGGQQQGGLMGTDLTPLLAALFQYGDKTPQQIQDIAREALERGDPFGPERAQYAQMLSQTYSDPQSVFDQQYGALDQTFFNELRAQDAARGRMTDAYKRGVEREAAFQNWMTGYRGQLGGFAGANIDPSAMAGQYMSNMNLAAMMGQYNKQAPWQAASQVFGGGQAGTGMTLGNIFDTAKGVYDTGKSIWDWGTSLFK